MNQQVDYLNLWLENMPLLMMVSLFSGVVYLSYSWKIKKEEVGIWLTVLLYVFIDVVTYTMGVFDIVNAWLYNIFIPFQVLIAIRVLIKMVQSEKTKNRFVTATIVLLIFHIVNVIWIQGLNEFGTYSLIPFNMLIATCAYIALRDCLSSDDISPFDQLSFWFALAFLIDYSGTLPLICTLAIPNFIHSELAKKMWHIVDGLYILWYLILVFGLIWTRATRSSRFSS